MRVTRKTIRSSSESRPRVGFLSMELVFTLPILMVVLLGLFEFSMLFFARGMVVEAARVGARKASLAGVTREDVEDEIRRVLDPRLQHGMQIKVRMAKKSGDVVGVKIWVPMVQASPDLLWVIGYSIKDEQLFHETRMIRE